MREICNHVGPKVWEVQPSCGGAHFRLEMCTHGWCPRSFAAVGVIRIAVWGLVQLGYKDFG